MKCNILRYKIDDVTKKMVLGDKKMEELGRVIVDKKYENFVKCPNWGHNNFFEASLVIYSIRDKQDKKLSGRIMPSIDVNVSFVNLIFE